MNNTSVATIYKNLAPQTKLALTGYGILLLVQAGLFLSPTNTTKTWAAAISGFIFFALFSVLSLYVINCTVVGHCEVYAWIISYLLVGVSVVALLSVVYMQSSQSKIFILTKK